MPDLVISISYEMDEGVEREARRCIERAMACLRDGDRFRSDYWLAEARERVCSGLKLSLKAK